MNKALKCDSTFVAKLAGYWGTKQARNVVGDRQESAVGKTDSRVEGRVVVRRQGHTKNQRPAVFRN